MGHTRRGFGRNGLAKQEPLSVRAADLQEKFELGHRLDMLRRARGFERLRQADQAFE